jgi:hypothetical protein
VVDAEGFKWLGTCQRPPRRFSLAAVPTRTHLFDGVETVLQRSNSDDEIVAARIQREHQIIGAGTHLLSHNVSVQILNGADKIGADDMTGNLRAVRLKDKIETLGMPRGLVTSSAAPEMVMLRTKQLMVLPANLITPDINTGLRGIARLSGKP